MNRRQPLGVPSISELRGDLLFELHELLFVDPGGLIRGMEDLFGDHEFFVGKQRRLSQARQWKKVSARAARSRRSEASVADRAAAGSTHPHRTIKAVSW